MHPKIRIKKASSLHVLLIYVDSYDTTKKYLIKVRCRDKNVLYFLVKKNSVRLVLQKVLKLPISKLQISKSVFLLRFFTRRTDRVVVQVRDGRLSKHS